jgi:hypothetical protein
MKTEIKTITPKEAKRIIESCNIDNRRIRDNNVSWLAQQMKAGEWMLTHQGIAFSESGRLLDGQHRLLAVIQADVPVKFMVTQGLDENAFRFVDCGERRSLSDLSKIDKKTVEVLRLAASALNAADLNNNKATVTQLLQLEEMGWGNLHRKLIAACATNRPTSSAIYRLAACVAAQHTEDETSVFALYRKIVLAQYEELPSVANAFLRQLNSGAINQTRNRMDAFCRYFKVLLPENANIKKLTLGEDERAQIWATVKNTLKSEVK